MRTFLRLITLSAMLAAAAPMARAQDNMQEFEEPGPEAPLPLPEENLVAPPPVYDDVPLEATGQNARLDELFGQLKKARDRRYARTVAASIWSQWYRSGSAVTDLMMSWASKAFEEKKYNVALDYLDQVTIRAPQFAEGWNRRATVHYSMDHFAKAMSDIEKTLAIEPRHFGALAGMATILERTGKKEAALKAWERALAVYPAMESAQQAVIRLSDELAADPV